MSRGQTHTRAGIARELCDAVLDTFAPGWMPIVLEDRGGDLTIGLVPHDALPSCRALVPGDLMWLPISRDGRGWVHPDRRV